MTPPKTYINDMSQYMDARGFACDVVNRINKALEYLTGDVRNQPLGSTKLSHGNASYHLNVVDIPYPPNKPAGFLLGVKIERTEQPLVAGLRVPFVKAAVSGETIRMYQPPLAEGETEDFEATKSRFEGYVVNALAEKLGMDYSELAQVVRDFKDTPVSAQPADTAPKAALV